MYRFAEKHRLLLNAYLRRTPNLLETSLAPLLHVPKLIEFDNKKVCVTEWDCWYLYRQLLST